MESFPVNTYSVPHMLWDGALTGEAESQRQNWTTTHSIPRDTCVAYLREFDACVRHASSFHMEARETFVVTWKMGAETIMVSGLKGEQCLARYAFIYECLEAFFQGNSPEPQHLATAVKYAVDVLNMIKEWANMPLQDIYSSSVKVPEFSIDHARITIEVACMVANIKAAEIASEVTETDTDHESVARLYRHAYNLALKVSQYRTRGLHSPRSQWMLSNASERVDFLMTRCLFHTIHRARLLGAWKDATACVRKLGNMRYMQDDLRRVCVLVEDHVAVLSSAQETHQCNSARFEWNIVPHACCILKDVCGIV